jgi:hypothetical protein
MLTPTIAPEASLEGVDFSDFTEFLETSVESVVGLLGVARNYQQQLEI